MLSILALALQGAPISDATSLEFDLQCITATTVAAQREEAPNAVIAPLSTYYLGRIDARGVDDAAIMAAARAASARIDGAPLGAILSACQRRLGDMGRRLNGIGAAQATSGEAPAGR
ncbi:hypothetical protein [Sphingomicrobium astaxanthinifaciens]|uniref:hypothetical protein n=1 Tax=Sphingomicrobium astaxanthinifaciens TaxID=1227949 RepID=UPI001FCA5939|nr:hypothetical protein [Sphingomicrobium astaxanthinifaciens]MCJ7421109.1 hypothetical protein [Sphingomicrobium astaxanthinifaciens]